MKYIDVHAHYEDVAYKEDLDQELKEIKKAGVDFVINSGSGIEESKKAIELSKKYKYIYCTIGIHPYLANEIEKIDEIENMYNNKGQGKIVAIGEIGLDYHISKEDREAQIRMFEEQLKLAKKLNLPVQIHSRDATEDMIEILNKTEILPDKIMLHCFDLNEEVAKIILKKGYSISVGGNITYKRTEQALKVLKNIPIDKIMTETDAPYLAPTGQRGKRNSSKYIGLIVEKLSEIKNMDVEEVSSIVYKNAIDFYNLK